jgi:HK97 family phage prohead protease
MNRRSIELDTGRRTIDVPVDSAGRVRRVATLDRRTITRTKGTDTIGFGGHAAVFDSRAWIGSKRWGFWEEIAPGAFAKTITESDVRFLHNHNPDLILARNAAGTLRLTEDRVGLAVDADMAPTSYAQDLALSLERGDVTQMSFAFEMIAYEWSYLEDGTEMLRHLEVSLADVSTVTYPAYPTTDASLRFDAVAAARSAGWDDTEVDQLARSLADPGPAALEALRSIAAGTPAATGPSLRARTLSERQRHLADGI